ncbi:hypothetical protein B0H19DRAFT_1086238 [Mycena capillaripes]|nr:hypothetical protein B0H19DRAFT_1086238 [Mycena capillaripes]
MRQSTADLRQSANVTTSVKRQCNIKASLHPARIHDEVPDFELVVGASAFDVNRHSSHSPGRVVEETGTPSCFLDPLQLRDGSHSLKVFVRAILSVSRSQVYSAVLVFVTQLLSTRQNLRTERPLTATHDTAAALARIWDYALQYATSSLNHISSVLDATTLGLHDGSLYEVLALNSGRDRISTVPELQGVMTEDAIPYSTITILDSNGSNGSWIKSQQTGDLIAEHFVFAIQLLRCLQSLVSQTAIVDAQSRQLISVTPADSENIVHVVSDGDAAGAECDRQSTSGVEQFDFGLDLWDRIHSQHSGQTDPKRHRLVIHLSSLCLQTYLYAYHGLNYDMLSNTLHMVAKKPLRHLGIFRSWQSEPIPYKPERSEGKSCWNQNTHECTHNQPRVPITPNNETPSYIQYWDTCGQYTIQAIDSFIPPELLMPELHGAIQEIVWIWGKDTKCLVPRGTHKLKCEYFSILNDSHGQQYISIAVNER